MNSPVKHKSVLSAVFLETAARLKAGARGLLTHKESLIAAYMLSDYTVKDIARFLYRSENTIEMHIKNLKRKCQCETRTRLGAVLQDFLKNNAGRDI